MTRKDYILIAKAITDTQKRIRNSGRDVEVREQLRGVRRAAAHLAAALAADNPPNANGGGFDAARFLTACGYGATSMNPSDPALDLRPLPDSDPEGARLEELNAATRRREARNGRSGVTGVQSREHKNWEQF